MRAAAGNRTRVRGSTVPDADHYTTAATANHWFGKLNMRDKEYKTAFAYMALVIRCNSAALS